MIGGRRERAIDAPYELDAAWVDRGIQLEHVDTGIGRVDGELGHDRPPHPGSDHALHRAVVLRAEHVVGPDSVGFESTVDEQLADVARRLTDQRMVVEFAWRDGGVGVLEFVVEDASQQDVLVVGLEQTDVDSGTSARMRPIRAGRTVADTDWNVPITRRPDTPRRSRSSSSSISSTRASTSRA